jgi:hypothetical protein
MMDGKRALAGPWTAARLAEATRRDRPFPADPTPEVPLPLARGRSLRHRLNRRHPRTPFLAGLLDQRQITPTDLRHHLILYANVQNKRRCEKTQKSLRPT